jgi:hypothetical protein
MGELRRIDPRGAPWVGRLAPVRGKEASSAAEEEKRPGGE